MPLATFCRPALLALALALGGCEMLGIESPDRLAAQKDADGKAVGSACRHALRAIEDCYSLNPKALKSAVFGGWREMDEYMREYMLEGVAPVLAKLPAKSDPEAEEGTDKPTAKVVERSASKGRGAKPAARAS